MSVYYFLGGIDFHGRVVVDDRIRVLWLETESLLKRYCKEDRSVDHKEVDRT